MSKQVPIIAPVRQRKLEVLERAPLPTKYSNEFLAGLMTNPELVRNVAIVGHLHHGKTLVRAGGSLVRQSSWLQPLRVAVFFCHACMGKPWYRNKLH